MMIEVCVDFLKKFAIATAVAVTAIAITSID